MIDETNLAIEELEEEIRRDNERRSAFYRMLSATDRVLWRLEELNRDGSKTIPADMRMRMRDSLTELPSSCLEIFRDSEHVQEVLDSIFEVQERLFRWRDPQRLAEEEEELERLAV
jgi:succinate dehydrogenase/fumarate reductase flavoprotein subunit